MRSQEIGSYPMNRFSIGMRNTIAMMPVEITSVANVVERLAISGADPNMLNKVNSLSKSNSSTAAWTK